MGLDLPAGIEIKDRAFCGRQYLFVQFKAPVSQKTVEATIDRLSLMPQFLAGVPVLWDFRYADMGFLDFENMSAMSSRIGKLECRVGARTAHLNIGPERLMLAKLWCDFMSHRDNQQRLVCETVGDALRWFLQPDDAIGDT